MAQPNPAYGTDTPHIALAGQNWPIPKMALRQNIKLQPMFGQVVAKIADAKTLVLDLSGQDMEALAGIAYVGLTRAHPDLTRDEFDNWEIGVKDLVGAAFVVVSQSGLYEPKEAAKPGENEGETAPQTGTA